MRVIETSRFGTIQVEEDRIFEFIHPVLGFERLKSYVLIDHAQDSPFKWLQSTEDTNTAFIVSNPIHFGIEYEFTVPEEETKRLDLQEAKDALVLTIVYIPQGAPHLMTANLAGPILINIRNRKGMQLVLSDSRYTTKHRLIPATEHKMASKKDDHS